MIELRWFVSFPDSKCPESVICGGDIVCKPIKRVLQYRFLRIFDGYWSDWQDVPTVTEEDSNDN